MRFISHLDLGRLFKRILRRAEIDIGFSNGFNPHELINIVQPLSLGYESEREYLEIDTVSAYQTDMLMDMMNISLPEGIRFTDCKEIPTGSHNMSGKCEYALYTAVLPFNEKINTDSVRNFCRQDNINILKKDKKTGRTVEKNIKSFILDISEPEKSDGMLKLEMTLRCASNETLNPGKLLESLLMYTGAGIEMEYIKIIRKDILGKDRNGKLVSIYEVA